jgi:hypothetical protein
MAKSEWINLNDAWAALGYSSYNALHSAFRRGLFREGKEVRDRRVPGAKRPRWQIHLGRAEQRLNTPPDKRSAL